MDRLKELCFWGRASCANPVYRFEKKKGEYTQGGFKGVLLENFKVKHPFATPGLEHRKCFSPTKKKLYNYMFGHIR